MKNNLGKNKRMVGFKEEERENKAETKQEGKIEQKMGKRQQKTFRD